MTLALVIWALAIAAHDVWRRRVPNWALLLVAAPALASYFVASGGLLGVGPTDALLGLATGFALTFPGYPLRQLGAGDVKYSALLGALLGFSGTLKLLLLAALMIGGMAVAAVVVSRYRGVRSSRLPAAVALSGGFLITLLADGSHGPEIPLLQ